LEKKNAKTKLDNSAALKASLVKSLPVMERKKKLRQLFSTEIGEKVH
jgi:hypothetical protein